MTEREKLKKSIKAHNIIKNHMILSMGAGFIPIPLADMVAVTAVQLDMVRQLSKLYEIDFAENEVKAIISALTTAGAAGLGARAVKAIPVVGSLLGGVTMAGLSGAATYAIGEVFYKHFESGGDFLNFDPKKVQDYYKERFEEGKKKAKDMDKDASVEIVVDADEEVISTTSDSTATSTTAQKESMTKADYQAHIIDQLERVKGLRDSGFLTEDEFQEMKKKIMSSM